MLGTLTAVSMLAEAPKEIEMGRAMAGAIAMRAGVAPGTAMAMAVEAAMAARAEVVGSMPTASVNAVTTATAMATRRFDSRNVLSTADANDERCVELS